MTSSLCHPNTVRVFDFGETESGGLYLAMERLVGETLEHALARCQRQRRPFGEIAARVVARAVLGSLTEAHAVGLVHQDLKPANIFLQRLAGGEFVTRVLDFGLAVSMSNDDAGSNRVAGTPQYMSPEQASQRPLDGRSDLYSLAVVLFECLAGRLPFIADAPMELLLMHVDEPFPGVASVCSWPVDPVMAAAVERALAKSCADRFEDAQAMQAALDGHSNSLDWRIAEGDSGGFDGGSEQTIQGMGLNVAAPSESKPLPPKVDSEAETQRFGQRAPVRRRMELVLTSINSHVSAQATSELETLDDLSKRR